MHHFNNCINLLQIKQLHKMFNQICGTLLGLSSRTEKLQVHSFISSHFIYFYYAQHNKSLGLLFNNIEGQECRVKEVKINSPPQPSLAARQAFNVGQKYIRPSLLIKANQQTEEFPYNGTSFSTHCSFCNRRQLHECRKNP